MTDNTMNAALSAAFGLPAGVPGREALILSATRLRAGEPSTLSVDELLAAASYARRKFFAAQKAEKTPVSAGERRARQIARSKAGPAKGSSSSAPKYGGGKKKRK
jgi:hypothetical protein